MKKLLILLTGFVITWQSAGAISPRYLAVTPGISLGYVFGAGISLGSDISYTPFYVKSGNSFTGLGIYGSYTMFYARGEIYRDNWYRSMAFGAAAFADDRFLLRAGISKSVLRWGADHRNKIKSKHFTPDLDISYDILNNGVFAGYHFFAPGNGCFGLDIKTVNTLYAAYRYKFNRQPISPKE